MTDRPHHPYLPSPVRVIAVNLDGAPLDCEDDDTAHVWVKVPGWTMRRAFLTGARPFAEAAGCEPAELAGRVFLTRLDLDHPPGNDDTAGERLEWPELRAAPPLPDDWTSHHDECTDHPTEETMTTERVTVRVLLLFGDQAEVVADVPPEERAEPERYPAAEIAAAVDMAANDLPGVRLTAEVGDDGRLAAWKLA